MGRPPPSGREWHAMVEQRDEGGPDRAGDVWVCDQALIDRRAADDIAAARTACAALLARHQRRTCAYLRAELGSQLGREPHEADDLWQDVAVNAWRRLRRPPPLQLHHGAHFGHYLHRIAEREVTREWRKPRVLPALREIRVPLDELVDMGSCEERYGWSE
jgi:DNA-directed RNA polymerase specialized sigma24 family protein